MATPTPRQMEQVLAAHELAEFEMDVDATMATLTDDPVYELPGLGWRISGRDAVAEMYRRLLPSGEKYSIVAERRVQAADSSTLFREAFLYFDSNEGRTTGGYIVAIAFEGDKIAGERMYMDSSMAKMMAEVLGSDFGDIPGVSKLTETNPPPKARPAHVSEHAANAYR
jgi:hypothetical protein